MVGQWDSKMGHFRPRRQLRTFTAANSDLTLAAPSISYSYFAEVISPLSAPSRKQPTFAMRSAMAQTTPATPELKLEIVTTSEETLVRCIGKMTFTSSGALQTTVRELIPETKRLVLDLAEMTYLDSFGLGALVSVYLSAKRQQCQLKLINTGEQGLYLLRLTNLTYLLE
jgi:anti-sigma B factor antagonist